MLFDPATFSANGKTEYGYDVGVVQSEKFGELKAVRNKYGVSVYGFVGRYRTSPKPWPAHVQISAENREMVHFGRDERSGRFNKHNAISFEPEIYAELTNPAFWEAV
ncbi:hypothetical protein B0E33_01300 [Roseibium algicola]|uniref:Uncharacterized protein n=1 Tax=Roseibium algicola TaxID=2857014 RepID=A0ABN4WNB6_9HYPH|nr:hypothetical protein [Roseibium aggregatum]AQQ02391.1 hypothetical protein B0E33_01300 [Roseibium aggregatum]